MTVTTRDMLMCGKFWLPLFDDILWKYLWHSSVLLRYDWWKREQIDQHTNTHQKNKKKRKNNNSRNGIDEAKNQIYFHRLIEQRQRQQRRILHSLFLCIIKFIFLGNERYSRMTLNMSEKISSLIRRTNFTLLRLESVSFSFMNCQTDWRKRPLIQLRQSEMIDYQGK